jgi:hypothetical protein
MAISRNWYRGALALWLGFAASLPAHAAAPTNKDELVTAETFNRLVGVTKRLLARINDLEAQLKASQTLGTPAGSAGTGSGSDAAARAELAKLRVRVAQLEAAAKQGGGAKGGGEGEVNLEDLDKQAAAPAAGPSAANAAASKSAPMLKVYFDLDFYAQPGGNAKGSGLTFDNFHSFVFLDVMPTEDIMFSTSIETPPKFYELDYRLFKPLTLRLGKIWIPFDDLTPHSIYGGMTNVSKIIVGENFLPDLFTDLGAGLTWKPADSPDFTLQLDGYVVNGFQSGGKDPVTPGSLYPDFGSLPTGPDNNKNKSIGGRGHALIAHTLGLGVSYYTGRWTNQDDPPEKLSMIGSDAQIYLTSTTTIRGGFATMDVKLPPGASAPNYLRNGTYAEIGQKFGGGDQFTFLLRGGTLNLDDRVVTQNNKQIAGAKLVWKPNVLEWSIEHSHDYKKVAAKTAYDFTNLRVVASF